MRVRELKVSWEQNKKQQLLLLRVSGGVNDTCHMGKVLRINNPVKREIRLVKKKLSF